MFLFMFFYDFLSINLYISLSSLFSVSFYNFLLINLHVSFHVSIYLSIYDFLSMLFHHVFEQMHWENFYHLLCAFSFYFSIFFENMHELNSLLLGKPLSFTMCFPILFPGERTGETPIIYYVLSHRVHSIPRRAHCHWGNPYYLLCASPSYSPAGSIFFENTHGPNPLLLGKPLLFTMCFPIGSGYWGNLYYLLCASPSYSPAGALGTPLLFTMCFPIVFFGERIAIGETSTI